MGNSQKSKAGKAAPTKPPLVQPAARESSKPKNNPAVVAPPSAPPSAPAQTRAPSPLIPVATTLSYHGPPTFWCEKDPTLDWNPNMYRVHQHRSCDYSPLWYAGVKIANAFVGSVDEMVPEQIVLLSRGQNCPSQTGSFWFEEKSDKVAPRFDFAVLPSWNLLKYKRYLAVPAGVRLYVGITREQALGREWLPGGGRQIFIPIEIAKLLQPLSDKFLDSLRTESCYASYLRDCSVVFAAQRMWLINYQREQNLHDTDADLHNYRMLVRERDAVMEAAEKNIVNGYKDMARLRDIVAYFRDSCKSAHGRLDFERLLVQIKEHLLNYVTEKSLLEGKHEDWSMEELIEVLNMHHAYWNQANSLDPAVLEIARNGSTENRIDDKFVNRKLFVHKTKHASLHITLEFVREETTGSGDNKLTIFYYNLIHTWTYSE